MVFSLRLLGIPQVYLEGEWQGLPGNQSFLLAAYLAYQEDWVRRDDIVALFWPDESEGKARHNLSQLLYKLKKSDWFIGLESGQSGLRYVINSDVRAFREAVGKGDWAQACERYCGNLLEGSFRGLSTHYEEWLALEREALKSTWREAALTYAASLEKKGEFSQATKLLQKVLKEDVLAEDVLQAYMRIAPQAGQRTQALKAFEAFKLQLQEELDILPLDETIQLAQAIRTTKLEQPQLSSPNEPANQTKGLEPQTRNAEITEINSIRTPAKPTKRAKLRNLPSQLTPFVGRELDLAEIASFLHSADTRLLTLLGPGGIGKTRLAIQTMLEQAQQFADGAVFVALASINSADAIIQELTGSLGLSFSAGSSLKEPLLDYLKAKEILMVIDNFEHVLDGSEIVLDILEMSPKSKLIVTSRETLGFQSEGLYEVKGLGVPASEEDKHVELHDAPQLFLRRARRVQASFMLQDKDRALVARICRLLGGVPLALELAANWLRVLSLEDIANELADNLDLLETEQRDVPPRHQSMRSVFEQSWSLLSQQERDALIKLSVFRGGFSKEASDKVSQTSLRTILALVNKSMIYRSPSGRYQRHPLVYEFIQEKAKATDLHKLQARHASYYADFLEAKKASLASESQAEALAAISQELENIRLAWWWALQNKQDDLLDKALSSLALYFDIQNLLAEAAKVFEQASYKLSHNQQLYARALCHYASVKRKQASHQKAKAMLLESLSLGLPEAETAVCFNQLAVVALFEGDFNEAQQLFQKSLTIFSQEDNHWGKANVLSNLGFMARQHGQHEKAKGFFEAALGYYRILKNKQAIANCLIDLGWILRSLGNNQEAKKHTEEALAIFKNMSDERSYFRALSQMADIFWILEQYDEAERHSLEGLSLMPDIAERQYIGTNYKILGNIELGRGNWAKAESYLKQGLELARAANAQPRIAILLTDLARVALQRRQLDEASSHLSAALKIAASLKLPRITLYILFEICQLASLKQDNEQAYKLLLAIKDHHDMELETKRKVAFLFKTVEASLSHEDIQDIHKQTENITLDMLTESLLI